MRSQALESGRGTAKAGRKAWLSAFGALATLLLALTGCSGSRPQDDGPRGSAEPSLEPDAGPAAAGAVPGKRFEEPGELDKLLDAKPIILAAVKPASQAQPSGGAAKSPEPISKGKGNFRIQVGAESDVDAAQAKKAEYEKLLGGNVDVVFDAPYYKLRWGYFDSKQDAEDKILELTDFKIQGFVVKQ